MKNDWILKVIGIVATVATIVATITGIISWLLPESSNECRVIIVAVIVLICLLYFGWKALIKDSFTKVKQGESTKEYYTRVFNVLDGKHDNLYELIVKKNLRQSGHIQTSDNPQWKKKECIPIKGGNLFVNIQDNTELAKIHFTNLYNKLKEKQK